ncbi:DUF2442 domain-containing protein [candidate division KSB1 bacterium]|nr:DUF2442 domain-containing protein [candidate division KSB1 bacterium]
MKLQKLGKNISDVEIQNISIYGIWLYVNGKEYFLSYKEYPWFKDAKVTEIYNLELLHDVHLYWPDLDVDLELESLENPEKYPLVYE